MPNLHIAHCLRCLRQGLGASHVVYDSTRMAIVFYCLSTLVLLDALDKVTTEEERGSWRVWIWKQYTNGEFGSGFRPSPYVEYDTTSNQTNDPPNLIMTYTALLCLSILRDDFSQLDRPSLLIFLRKTQRGDGSFSHFPGHQESDLRMVYCAFSISRMLDNWSGIDIKKAVEFIRHCRTYEGGYGQAPFQEAQGGTTYCAIASLYMAPIPCQLTELETKRTLRWLLHNQVQGFRGRTEKTPDACYSFWCGAATHILGAQDLVNLEANAEFLESCEFKYGGIAKAPGEHPDPLHTYLSFAALSLFPVPSKQEAARWKLGNLEPLLNAQVDIAHWALSRIPSKDI